VGGGDGSRASCANGPLGCIVSLTLVVKDKAISFVAKGPASASYFDNLVKGVVLLL